MKELLASALVLQSVTRIRPKMSSSKLFSTFPKPRHYDGKESAFTELMLLLSHRKGQSGMETLKSSQVTCISPVIDISAFA
jgi:hypothetical protein